MESKTSEGPTTRARVWETDRYEWSLYRAASVINIGGKQHRHPKRTSAVFVVHGMGQPTWVETAATLRAGFEDALERTRKWQARQRKKQEKLRDKGKSHREVVISPKALPPPYISDGHWGDYPDIEKTFPDDWKRFNERQREFFSELWKRRAVSRRRTAWWFCKQLIKLLNPRLIFTVPLAWFLYLTLLALLPVSMLLMLFFSPRFLTRFLGDVRLYFDPRGVVEKAIAQNIDQRVGEHFLRLIGLDWDFRELKGKDQLHASGKAVRFERVVWVAHSLGTVVSYNVLSDLFTRAEAIMQGDDDEQKRGVDRFRGSLRRFVTLGSPLDKAAFLFPKEAIKPWPLENRRRLLYNGETIEGTDEHEWWINFYHYLDPVSGALSNEDICGPTPPKNVHIGVFRLPGVAHVDYWKDNRVLRFILTRTYGRKVLWDKEYKSRSPLVLAGIAAFSYVVWLGLFYALFFTDLVKWVWQMREYLPFLGA